jgi:hypothetical protein
MLRAFVIATALLVTLGAAARTSAAGPSVCSRPSPGRPAGSCAALKTSDIAQSKHAGDVWLDCEEMSGRHPTLGSGAVAFFKKEAKPYWNNEIEAYMAALKAILPSSEYKPLLRQHQAWANQRPALERQAAQNVYEGGLMSWYLTERNVMGVARQHALALGCTLETANGIHVVPSEP